MRLGSGVGRCRRHRGWEYMQAKESLRDAMLACQYGPDDYNYRFYWQEVFGSDFGR
jgi:hypothetical protein